MDESDFSRRLKEIKAEVLALKQAHEYGLGAFNFYYKSASIDTPPASLEDVNLRLTIKYGDDVNQLPFQILRFNPKVVYGITWNSNTHEYRVAYSDNNLISTTHYVFLVSSKPVVSMEIVKV